MTDREALRLALEALRNSQDYKQGRASTIEAVEDIEEALAQPEQEPSLQEQLDEAYADMAQANADKEKASADCEKAYNEAKRIEKLIEETNT
jgi:hypothetical protein